MKSQIHPQWFDAKVTCACGNSFVVGSTIPEFKVEICSQCHPFYTGQMKYIDTAGRVDAFKARLANAKGSSLTKSEKRAQKREKKRLEEESRPETLEELRKELAKTKAK